MQPSLWDVREVCCWLCTCDLGHLQVVFQRNKIDGAGLLMLTREELREELQIEGYVDRKRLWAEVTKLRSRDLPAGGSSNGGPFAPQGGLGRRDSDLESRHSHLSQSLSGVLSPVSSPPVGLGVPPSPSASNHSSTDLSSEWSSAAFVDKQKYNLRLCDDTQLAIDDLARVHALFLQHVGGVCTVSEIAKLAARHQEVMVALLCRLLYGLVGKKTPSESVIKHDALHNSAITLLRAYGLTNTGAGPLTLDAAARGLRLLPLTRLVRDAFRVCEGAMPPKSAHSVIPQVDVELFLQVFQLKDVLLKLPPPPPPGVRTPTRSGGSAYSTPCHTPGAEVAVGLPSPVDDRVSDEAATRPLDMQALTRRVVASQALAEAVLAGMICALTEADDAKAHVAAQGPEDPLPIASVSLLAAYGITVPDEDGVRNMTLRKCAAHMRQQLSHTQVAHILTAITRAMGVRTEGTFTERFGVSRSSFPAARTTPLGARAGLSGGLGGSFSLTWDAPVPEAKAGRGVGSEGAVRARAESSMRRKCEGPESPEAEVLTPRQRLASAKAGSAPPQRPRRGSASSTSTQSTASSLTQRTAVPPTLPTSDVAFRVGDRVQISGSAAEVEQVCRGNPWVGFDPDMLRHLNAHGRVKRCNERDIKARKVQVAHDDATWTWPFEVVRRVATKNPILEYTLCGPAGAGPCSVHATPCAQAAVVVVLPVGSTIHVAESRDGWHRLHGGGWVTARMPGGGEWRSAAITPASPPTLTLESPPDSTSPMLGGGRAGYSNPPALSLRKAPAARAAPIAYASDDEVPL